MSATTSVRLPAGDAWELAELLGFVADFLAKAEGPLLRADFAAHSAGAYQLNELRADLARFAFLLGGDGDRFIDGDDQQ